jgi:ComF family protein
MNAAASREDAAPGRAGTLAALLGAASLGWLGRGTVRLARATFDLLLPAHCLTCDAPVEGTGQFCARCFGAVGFIGAPACRSCGLPFASTGFAGGSGVCSRCADHPPPWGRAVAAMLYEGRGRDLILGFKRADRVEAAVPLARYMARAGAALLAEADLLVPVPLHRRRLLARRYNQSALLARHLGRLARRAVVPDGLRRLRRTEALAWKSAAARRAELEGAFAVPPARLERVRGRRVLLIDDILTSGATAAACAEALLRAGARSVDVLVAARTRLPEA